MKTKWLQGPHLQDLGDRLCCAALVCSVFAGLVLLTKFIGSIWRPM